MTQNTDLWIVVIFSVLGAIAGVLITVIVFHWRSKRFRRQQGIPNVIGKWKCQWFDDAADPARPKIEDVVEIKRWIHKGEFEGLGHQQDLSYPLMGEIDPSRVITLVYKAARYPYELNRGVVCMELSRDNASMEGRWFGRRSSNQLGGGRVKCLRVHEEAKNVG
jgi:hypothetical protein